MPDEQADELPDSEDETSGDAFGRWCQENGFTAADVETLAAVCMTDGLKPEGLSPMVYRLFTAECCEMLDGVADEQDEDTEAHVAAVSAMILMLAERAVAAAYLLGMRAGVTPPAAGPARPAPTGAG